MSQANYQYHHSQHEHSHHEHHHHGSGNALLWPLLLTLGFAIVEAAGGWFTGSLALLGDAGHMFSDSAALGLSLIHISEPTRRTPISYAVFCLKKKKKNTSKSKR